MSCIDLAMTDKRDYILELGGKEIQADDETTDRKWLATGVKRNRPFISVHFECCDVYTRIYRDRDKNAYVGWCPRCARKAVVKVAPDGVNCRFFKAK